MSEKRSYSAVIPVKGRAVISVGAASLEDATARILNGEWDYDELIEWECDFDSSRPPSVSEDT